MKVLELSPADFAYGNARLRARKAALLSRADYETLLGKSVDELLAVLAGTAYHSAVEAALPRFHGLRRLHEAVRSHLARSLEDMRSFYEGDARELVDLLLAPWDLRNLLTLLRGRAHGAPPEDVLPNVIPIGGIDEAAAREVARQTELAAAVQLLAAWRLPTPEDARALWAAWPDYERSEDFAALEHALAAAHSSRIAAALEQAAPDADPLRLAFQREIDARNVGIALRLRDAAVREELAELPGAYDETFLPRGSVPAESLDAAMRSVTAMDALGALTAVRAGERWRGPLERWARTGDLVALQRDLEIAATREAVALFRQGDPLSIAIPVAFAAAKENEARNLRVLGEGAARGTDPHVVQSQLLVP